MNKPRNTRNNRNTQPTRRPVATVCAFCREGLIPDYKNWEVLDKFITDRKRIANRTRSGVCAKHQRQLTREIKRARHLALLPFSARLS